MILLRLLLILLFVFSACADDSSKEDPIYLEPPEEGKGIQMAFDYVAPPNQEIWMCYVFELELPDSYMYDDWFANVNRVESVQNFGNKTKYQKQQTLSKAYSNPNSIQVQNDFNGSGCGL